jgi:hypothetical protein
MVGLGLTRLEPLRSFASSSSPGMASIAEPGGPASGPYSADGLRAAAAQAARLAGDDSLAHELSEVCCWAPAATAIRRRPLAIQERGAQYFFRDFPGGDQLAETLLYANNTAWRRPRFRFDPEGLVEKHYALLRRPAAGVRTDVLTPNRLARRGDRAELGLMLDRKTGDRLANAADRSEPMWAALSIFSGILLDPTDELSSQLRPVLSLTRAQDRALARTAAVRYSQAVLGSVQRAIWSDLLDGANPALPLVQLAAAGFLPLGEEDGRFLLLRFSEGSYLTGYRSATA